MGGRRNNYNRNNQNNQNKQNGQGNRNPNGGNWNSNQNSHNNNNYRPNQNNNNHANNYANNTSTNQIQITIKGLSQSNAASNPDGGIGSLKQWLERRSQRTVQDIYQNGDVVSIKVRQEDVSRFTHLNGFQFANATLSVSEEPNQSNGSSNQIQNQIQGGAQSGVQYPVSIDIDGSNPSTDQLEAALVTVIRRRYVAGSKYLDLSKLPGEAEFITMGLSAQPASKVFSAIFVCCETKVFETPLKRQQMVESLSLAENGLTTVKDCISAAGSFNHIKNLDLSKNNIADVGELRYWRNKFPNLEHLILQGNPLDSPETALKMKQWYKHLKLYNNEPVPGAATAAAAAVPKANTVGIALLPNDVHPEIPPGHDYGQVAPGKTSDVLMKEQMALRFSYETRLNLEMSQQCLIANNFDYQKALNDLANLISQGSIPQDKFLWTQ